MSLPVERPEPKQIAVARSGREPSGLPARRAGFAAAKPQRGRSVGGTCDLAVDLRPHRAAGGQVNGIHLRFGPEDLGRRVDRCHLPVVQAVAADDFVRRVREAGRVALDVDDDVQAAAPPAQDGTLRPGQLQEHLLLLRLPVAGYEVVGIAAHRRVDESVVRDDGVDTLHDLRALHAVIEKLPGVGIEPRRSPLPVAAQVEGPVRPPTVAVVPGVRRGSEGLQLPVRRVHAGDVSGPRLRFGVFRKRVDAAVGHKLQECAVAHLPRERRDRLGLEVDLVDCPRIAADDVVPEQHVRAEPVVGTARAQHGRFEAVATPHEGAESFGAQRRRVGRDLNWRGGSQGAGMMGLEGQGWAEVIGIVFGIVSRKRSKENQENHGLRGLHGKNERDCECVGRPPGWLGRSRRRRRGTDLIPGVGRCSPSASSGRVFPVPQISIDFGPPSGTLGPSESLGTDSPRTPREGTMACNHVP